MREAALYPAVKRFLAARGFEAKGEVGGCDVVGVRDGEPPVLVIGEMKLGFTLDLVLQGVDRLASADEVWLVVRATRRGRDRDRRARALCRLLGFGLLAVAVLAFAWIARSFRSEPPVRTPATGGRPAPLAAD